MIKKINIINVYILILLICACSSKQQVACLPIVVVYPTWSATQLPLESIPWNKFTHITLTFILPKADGSLDTQDMDKIIDLLVTSAHTHNKKVFVSIGGAIGYGDAFQKIAADKSLLKKFSGAVKNYVDLHHIDGIDIDWEYWTKQVVKGEGGNDPFESRLLVDLLASLRSELPVNVQMTTDIFAGYWYGEQYLPEIQDSVDYVTLMTYDFTGAWEGSAIHHHADYETFKKSIELALNRGFKNEKMLIGFPAYGIEFIDGKNQQVNRDYSHKQIVELVKKEGLDINIGKLGNLYFETPELVKAKSRYILDLHLAGIFMFELTQDTKDDATSLLSASSQVISSGFCKP